MDRILVNLGYVFMFAAMAARDVLWLRGILALGQLSLCGYGWVSHLPPVAYWNAVFVALNLAQVARLLNERRPLRLPPELAELHRSVFSAMTSRELLYFWEMGARRDVVGERLIREGEKQKDLTLVTEGKVAVLQGGRKIAELSRGSFIADMSFMTGEPASADVVADGPVRIVSWEQEKLRSLDQLNPKLLIKLQGILGKDLTKKIRASRGS
jgi:hypothetical protein